MTIALGMLASDGFVVAADTHESRGIYKIEHGKMSAVLTATERPTGASSSYRCCAITGSGAAHHLDAVTKKIIERIRDGEALSDDELEAECGRILREFYLNHVAPFAAYPEPERPDFQLLLGAQLFKDRLLVSDKTIFKDASPYVAIGVGEIVAMPLLTRFYQLPMPDVRSAILLASYVIYHVKESIEGCGKSTDMAGVRNGHFFQIRRPDTKALENAVSEYSTWLEPMLLRKLTQTDTPKQRAASTKAQARIKRLIQHLKLPD